MRPLAFLQCLGKAALKQAANLAGFGLVDAVEEVWKDWKKERDEAGRQAELQAIAQMAADQLRQQIEAIVREVAAEQPAEVRQRVSSCLQQIPELVRRSFCRPEDQQGRSVPPGFRLQQASDLAKVLSCLPSPIPSPAGVRERQVVENSAATGTRVELQITQGHRAGETILCTEPTVLLFGRAKDCEPKIPREGHEGVSRHHCFVEVNPPDVRVRDLGSRSGTFVNGTLIGKRPAGEDPDPTKYSSEEVEVPNDAEVRLTKSGQITFRVRIHVEQREDAVAVKTCAWCHREATERGANRPGMFVCSSCRGNMQSIMQDMMGQAKAGNQELRAVRSFTVLQELGHGGMGAVFLAKHERTGQPAAIKLMLPQVAADDRAVEMFQREVRNTMTLNHRHVVRLLDHGYARGTFFMLLEYCEGGSVDRLMEERGGTLPIDEAVGIVLQALEGLEYAHQADIPFVKQKGGGYAPGKGLIHRDLKPANLFLTGRGSSRIVKIGDYGLAKAFDETGLSGGTRTGEVAGTWQFMCRQQVAGFKNAQPEVDVWAMAASLYAMLTGTTPRDFPKDRDPWLVVLESPSVPIRQRNPKVPARLAELIDEALVEEPAIRFKTASEFKQALEDVL